MPTECSADLFGFEAVEGRRVEAAFDGGRITSDAGALLLGATARAIGLIDRFAACFDDHRQPELIEHEVATLVGQRVFGIALGYEDLNDHDELRHDPMMAVLAGKLAARRRTCAALAGKITLNRLELSRSEPTRYHKIGHDGAAIERLFVDLFLEAHAAAPEQIMLDLDATDDPLHGEQEGRFFHGYYDGYCYLPLYVFCGRHLLAAKLRPRQHRRARPARSRRWRASSPRSAPLAAGAHPAARRLRLCPRGPDGWCEGNGVDYVFGLARNRRLDGRDRRRAGRRPPPRARRTGQPARRFKDFTLDDAQELEPAAARRRQGRDGPSGEANPRFVVTSLGAHGLRGPRALRGRLLRPRRDGEPHQGMPARPVRRPHLGRHHARQPAAAVVRLDGLCAALRPAPHRPGRHPVRRRHLRHHPPQAAQDRRPGAHQRAPHQDRHGLRLPLPARVRSAYVLLGDALR